MSYARSVIWRAVRRWIRRGWERLACPWGPQRPGGWPALDPRVRAAIDVCCLTNYESLIEARGLSKHGVYYYVPGLLKHFDTFQINELIVPRAHLSVNGRRDELTPPAGVEQVRDKLLPLYRTMARPKTVRSNSSIAPTRSYR